LLGELGIRLLVRDERCAGEPLDVSFCGQLTPEQLAAAKTLIAHDTGVLAATTAFGRTVIAAWVLAQRRERDLLPMSWDLTMKRLAPQVGLEPTTLRLTAGFSSFCRVLPHIAPSCWKAPISLGVKNLSLAGTCRVLLEVAASCGTQKARKRQCGSRRVGDRRSPCGPVAEQDGTPPAGDGPAVVRCDRSGPAPGRVASRSPDGAPPDRVPDRSSLHRVGRRGVWHRTEVLLFRGSGESARGSCRGRSARETRRGRAAETRRLQQRPGRQSDGRWN